MTPKEKAKELVDKMRNINTKDKQLGKMYFIVPKQIAILQALITLNEMFEEISKWSGGEFQEWEKERWKYLQEVKQEIEKL